MGAAEICNNPVKAPEKTAILVSAALLFGSIFALITPPFQSPDEPNHFLRAYQVSEGVFFPETAEQRLGGTLPASLQEVCDAFAYLKMNGQARLDRELIFKNLHTPLNAGTRRFTDFPNTAVYAPTAYLPQAGAIVLLRPLGASPLQMLYGARMANLLVWLLLVYSTLRLMPFLRDSLTLLALLPASLVIAASANADVVTNGLCWWLVAAFLNTVVEQKPRSALFYLKQGAAFLAACINKLIVVPIVILRFLPKTSARASGLLTITGLAGALCWGSLAGKWFIPYDAYNPAFRDAQTLNEGVDPARQMAFVRDNPIYFIQTAATSLVRSLPSTAAHFTGKFGWEKNYLGPVWLALLWLALAAVLFSEQYRAGQRLRWLAASAVFLFTGMFAFTMYAIWCPVGAGEVTNFQGRYFVPVAPLVALAVANGLLQRFRREIRMAALLVLLLGTGAMVIAILQRYYW